MVAATKMDEDLKQSLGMYCQTPTGAIINVWDSKYTSTPRPQLDFQGCL